MKKRRTSKIGKRMTAANVRNTSMKVQHGYPTGPATAITMGRLENARLPWPAYATANTLTNRTRNIIKVSSIKICRHFEYPDTVNDVGPIEVHWCLVQAKDPDMLHTSLDYLNDFFRDNSTSTSRTTNFPSYVGSSPWNLLLNCGAINPNNKLKVLTHQRKMLTQYSLVAGRKDDHLWRINRFYKVNKNMSFEQTTDTEPQNTIFELFWYNTVSPSKFPADPTAVQYIETDRANTVYWKNMRS